MIAIAVEIFLLLAQVVALVMLPVGLFILLTRLRDWLAR